MKKLFILCSLLFVIGLSYAFCQSDGITLSILEREDPSWVYRISSDEPMNIEFQVRDAENRITSSDIISVTDGYTSKFSIYNIPTNDFHIVILRSGTEIYRETFSKNH